MPDRRLTPELVGEAADRDPLNVGELVPLSVVATEFGLSAGSLRDYVRRGRLAARKYGRDWMTTAEAVRVYLASRDTAKIPTRYRDRG